MSCRVQDDRIHLAGPDSGSAHFSEAYGVAIKVRIGAVLACVISGLYNNPFTLICRMKNIPCEIITPKQVGVLHPLINIHDLVGAMYVPEDAVVSTADVALALVTAAQSAGERGVEWISKGR